ncbi:MAG: hypothetical protein ACUVWR_14420 [Anaerolineae bacterium]
MVAQTAIHQRWQANALLYPHKQWYVVYSFMLEHQLVFHEDK